MSKVLIIGGTRFIGPSLVRNLLDCGDQVLIFARGNYYGIDVDERASFLRGDRDSVNDLKQLSSYSPDFIYDMCCYGPEQAENLTKRLGRKTKHLIFFSTVAVYQKPSILPLNEDSSLGSWSSFGNYGTRKAAAENVFINFGKENNVKITIFRPVYLLGKNNYFDRENYYFSRIHLGLPILVPGDGNALLQFAFLEETAQAFMLCPKRQSSKIEILNVGSDEYISVMDFIKRCATLVGKKPKIAKLDTKKFGLNEERFYDDLYPFPNISLIVSNEKIKQKYKIHFQPFAEGLREIYQSWRETWNGKVVRYKKEKDILLKLGIS